MLPRSFCRIARGSTSSSSQSCCRVCTCKCGRTIRRNGLQTPPTRSYASRQQPRSTSARAGPVKQQTVPQGLSPDNATRLYRALMQRKLGRSLQGQPDQLLRFVEAFTDLAAVKVPKAGPGVDISAFKEMINEKEISRKDARWCARWMVADSEPDFRQLGRKMMYTMSHAGDGLATLTIMEGTLAETVNRVSLLKSSELLLVRRQLADMAAGKFPYAMEKPEQSFMAKVCEGKVAYCLGDVDYAFDLWTSAMDDAVAYANQHGSKDRDPAVMRANSSPWIDLFDASFARGSMEKARWAAGIGCQIDDPVSHYHAATLEHRTRKHPKSVTTSDWLYHVTKAAGSGHVKAIHALGVYYSTAEWKYFADEPPDHCKPTPFDSHPPPERRQPSVGQRLGAVFGLQPAAAVDPKRRLFLTAVFPDSPYERWKLAVTWLETAMRMMYAPSFLVAAKLYAQDSLHPRTAPPEEAIQLSDQRYEYASKADFEAGRRIRLSTPKRSDFKEEERIRNPGFNPDKAKDLIREVFYAVQADAYRRNRISQLDKSRSSKSNAVQPPDLNKMLSEEMLESNVSPDIRKWFRFPEVMQTYTGGKQGTLYDDYINVDVAMEARRMCDEIGWDLYDEEGGLVYKHRSS